MIVALISFRPVILAKDVVLLVMIASGLASATASAHLTEIAVQTIQRFALRVSSIKFCTAVMLHRMEAEFGHPITWKILL